MRAWLVAVPFVVLLSLGCARPAARPGLQPGDTVRAEVSFAPGEPWHAGDKVDVGVLLRGERPGGEGYYVKDEEVVIARAVMGVRLTFLNGDRVVGEPLEVPLIHDC